ncbi:DUF402 domain-containing protein [Sutcliffiella rhizosphaerae]|uniref:DUF402 domain-containing protein n=1 Tax=Sutcliffiella rhizosphaerae TaxID=2880967 RepID=A0ABM8YP13_9BACI|nr:DUF402 domain-containing protein [Sutcliffiella rhizosphaerae]CAG9621638.1 hypothetical protein BACCIP111883_02411 [Sutcliffiella rhizosphaerae]
MKKVKYASRPEWNRVTKRNYSQYYLRNHTFSGHISLIQIQEITTPLLVNYEGNELCIADHGYFWLQHFPTGENYSVTTSINDKGEILQWYIDICEKISLLPEEEPWLKDLYLDIIVLPSGEVFRLDEEELKEAFQSGYINKKEMETAIKAANDIEDRVRTNRFPLLGTSEEHLSLMINRWNCSYPKRPY